LLATNDQLPVARRPRGAFFVLTALVALALTGCGGARARSPEAARADRASLPGGIPPADFRTAALNSRILSQASPAGTEEDLPVGPGDLIQVSVFEVKELSDIKVRVPLRGAITLPLLGAIPAAGRTAVQLEQDIRGRLQEKYMHDPQVSVFVVEPKSQRISVIGAVRRGGIYPMTSRLRLADALALAEGLSDDADHVIYLVRRVPAGTVAMVEAGQEPPAPPAPLAPPAPVGPPAPPPAEAVSGADAAANATEAVMAAIDLDALVAGRDELNVPLQAGDVINVPRAGSYYVGGSVERQGSFFLKAKTTVEQAITAAGGVKNVADWEDIRIYRTKSDGQREILTASLTKIEKGAPAPELQKNDVVVVGKSGTKAFFYGAADFFKGMLGFGLSKGL
jgi:polysaccharide export outer membrane protein